MSKIWKIKCERYERCGKYAICEKYEKCGKDEKCEKYDTLLWKMWKNVNMW